MATSFLLTNCNLSLLMPEIIDQCHPFTCGTDDDMDEFFRKDALDYTHFLMGKSYCFRLKNDPKVLRFYEKNNFKPLFPREDRRGYLYQAAQGQCRTHRANATSLPPQNPPDVLRPLGRIALHHFTLTNNCMMRCETR